MKRFILSILLTLGIQALYGQLSVQVIVPPLPSRVSELFDQSDRIQLIVTNTSSSEQRFRASGKVGIDDAVIASILPSQSPVEIIGPGQVRTYNLNDLAVFQNSIDYQSPVVINILRSGYLPAGYLNWCFTLHQADNPSIILCQEQCRGARTTTYQAPVALFPDNGEVLPATGLSMFRWSPVTPVYPGALRYELSVFEIQPGQEPIQALRVNQPLWQNSVPSTQVNWPVEVPREPGQYVWIVRAFDNAGNLVGSGETSTEPRIFSIPSTQVANGVNQQTRVPELPFVQMQLKPKGSSQVVQTLILPSNNMEAIQELFNQCDQKNRFDIDLKAVPLVTQVNPDKAQPVLNGKGDLVLVANANGPVLSFKNNASNSDWIGLNSGAMFIWRDSFAKSAKGGKSTSRDRVRRLVDACKGLQSFLVFN